MKKLLSVLVVLVAVLSVFAAMPVSMSGQFAIKYDSADKRFSENWYSDDFGYTGLIWDLSDKSTDTSWKVRFRLPVTGTNTTTAQAMEKIDVRDAWIQHTLFNASGMKFQVKFGQFSDYNFGYTGYWNLPNYNFDSGTTRTIAVQPIFTYSANGMSVAARLPVSFTAADKVSAEIAASASMSGITVYVNTGSLTATTLKMNADVVVDLNKLAKLPVTLWTGFMMNGTANQFGLCVTSTVADINLGAEFSATDMKTFGIDLGASGSAMGLDYSANFIIADFNKAGEMTLKGEVLYPVQKITYKAGLEITTGTSVNVAYNAGVLIKF